MQSNRLILRDSVTIKECVIDAYLNYQYHETTYVNVESMAFSLAADSLRIINFDTIKTAIIRVDTFKFARRGTGTGLVGMWVTGPSLPDTHYVSGSPDADSQGVWHYAVSGWDTLNIRNDSLYSWSQSIIYENTPDDLAKQSVRDMLNGYKQSVPSITIIESSNSITASDTALHGNNLVIAFNGSYPTLSETATYKSQTGTWYMKPDSKVNCENQWIFNDVITAFYNDLTIAYPKRAAGTAR